MNMIVGGKNIKSNRNINTITEVYHPKEGHVNCI